MKSRGNLFLNPNHISIKLGKIHNVAELANLGYSATEVRGLELAGLKKYSEFGSLPENTINEVLEECIQKANIPPEQIDLLLLVSTTSSSAIIESMLGSKLQQHFKMFDTRWCFISGHDCANFALALNVANSLVKDNTYRSVAILQIDIVGQGSIPRLIPNWTVHSDAVSCAILTQNSQPWHIDSSKIFSFSQTEAQQPRSYLYEHTSQFLTKFLSESSVSIDEVDHIICNNYNDFVTSKLASIFGKKRTAMIDSSLPNQGHCFSTDLLANFKSLVNTDASAKKLLFFSGSRHSLGFTLATKVPSKT